MTKTRAATRPDTAPGAEPTPTSHTDRAAPKKRARTRTQKQVRANRPSSSAEAAADLTAPTPAQSGRRTKIDLVRGMLTSPDGATLAALAEATGWQDHTVRAALSGLRRSGARIEREPAPGGGSRYRIAGACAAGVMTR